MSEDLHALGEDLVSVAARVVRWTPTDGVSMSIALARILARLQDKGPSKISRIAALERSSQPTITAHVQRLEAAGWVSRGTDPTDARASVITLTADGAAELLRMRDILGTNLAPALLTLTEDERDALRTGIEMMRKLLLWAPPEPEPVEAEDE